MIAHLRHRRYFVAALAGTISIAFIVLVAASPLALRELASSFDLNWSSLSNVGQTYGAVSALITGLALGGVAISLFYQAKDISTTRSQAVRTFHHELLRMELDDEDCMWASGAPWGYGRTGKLPGPPAARLRSHVGVILGKPIHYR